MKKIVKIVDFQGNSGNSGGDGGEDGALNSDHRGTVREKTARDLGERVPRVPLGIPRCILAHRSASLIVHMYGCHKL